jgi:hypothetical protein
MEEESLKVSHVVSQGAAAKLVFLLWTKKVLLR